MVTCCVRVADGLYSSLVRALAVLSCTCDHDIFLTSTKKKTPRTFTVFFMKQNGILTKNESKQRTAARTAGCDESGVYSAGVYILLCRPQRFGPGYFRGHIHCGRGGQYGSICQLQSGQFPPQLTAGDKAGRYFWGGGGMITWPLAHK